MQPTVGRIAFMFAVQYRMTTTMVVQKYLLRVAKLNGCVSAHSVLETVLLQSILEMGDDFASARVVESTTTAHHHHVRLGHIAQEPSVYCNTEFGSSWNQSDPRPEPSSKCHPSYAVCSLSLAAPSPTIIPNKRWCGHLGHQPEEICGAGSHHAFN